MLNAMVIDVWMVFLDSGDLAHDVAEGLSEAEWTRASRLRDPVRRRRFITARGVVRALLGERIGTSPSRLEFVAGIRGKPGLRDHPRLGFNLSHSGPWLALAIGEAIEVGIDIERIRTGDPGRVTALARRFLAPEEQAELGRHGVPERGPAFTRLWTCKEAYAKARGIGLGMPLRSYSITGFGDAEPRLRWSRNWPGDPETFTVRTLPAPDGYAAALVFPEATDRPVRLIRHCIGAADGGRIGISTIMARDVKRT